MLMNSYTSEEYFELDEAAPKGVRLEYFDGRIFHQGRVFEPSKGWDAARALAGAAPEHSRIKHNVERLIGNQLHDRGCDILSSDQRVQVKTRSGYVYPDIVVSCDPEYDGVTLQNPQLLIEILSKSTARYDLTRKKEAYATIASMQEYWFISTREVDVFQCVRGEEGWTLRHITDLALNLESKHFGIKLPLSEVYHRVFSSPPPQSPP